MRQSQEEKEAELLKNREYKSAMKSCQTSEEAQHAREANRIRMATQRENETPLQRQQRQEADRQRMATQRENETPLQRQQRLEAMRQRKATKIQNETPAQRKLRQETEAASQAQRRIAHLTKPQWLRGAFKYDPTFEYALDKAVSIGTMSKVCKHETCKAKLFFHQDTKAGEPEGMCCGKGKVPNLIPKVPPEPLRTLLQDSSKEAKDFRKLSRAYNSAFQMTSFGAGKIVREGNFMPTYKVQGQVHHTIGSLLPLQNETHKFLQLYFVGRSQAQAEGRQSAISNMSKNTQIELILKLQEMLHNCNPYVKDFKYVLEHHKQGPDYKVVIDEHKRPAGSHKGRYNEQACNEVAVVMAGGSFGTHRDIILETRNKQLKRINETHRSYDALQYPLLFPWGDNGYHTELFHANRKISSMDFYAYQIMVRDPISQLHRAGELFSQYLVDMFAKVEAERLLFVKLNQKQLRVDNYANLKDDTYNDRMNGHQCRQEPKCHRCTNGRQGEKGQLVILPSSHTGSPRYMHERTQDGMKYVQQFGRPCLFVTFTCNPNWKEIKANLLDGQRPQDRHDLVASRFAFISSQLGLQVNVTKRHGRPNCWTYFMPSCVRSCM